MDSNQIQSIMGKYTSDAQISIITSLKVLQDNGCEVGSDPLLIHIILGKKVRAQTSEIEVLKDNLEKFQELNS